MLVVKVHNWIDNIPLTPCFIYTAVLKNYELSSHVIAYIGIQVDRTYKVVLDTSIMFTAANCINQGHSGILHIENCPTYLTAVYLAPREGCRSLLSMKYPPAVFTTV